MTTLEKMNEGEHFALVMKQAEMLANAQIIPSAYRKKPADIVAAGLAGRAYGWDIMSAMRNFHVIEGTASMRPEAMLGLVRHAGHSVMIEVSNNRAIAKGKRCDSGDTHTAEFSTHDAETAGLLQKRNWKQYGDAMLTWRAVSILCRVLFPDVVLGAGYVPEELGVEDTNHEGEIIEVEFPTVEILNEGPPVEGEADDLKEQIGELSDIDKELLKTWWKTEGIPSLSSGEMSGQDIDRVSDRIEFLLGV